MGAEPVVADSNTIWLTENCTTAWSFQDSKTDWQIEGEEKEDCYWQ